MPYTKMRNDYFVQLSQALTRTNYINIKLMSYMEPVVRILERSDTGEELVVMESDRKKSKSNNILDLCHEMSTRLNNGIPPYPLYAKTGMRRKTLDSVVQADYQISFYRLADNRIFGIITKVIDGQTYEIFSGISENLKDSFELLDSHIYNTFGYYCRDMMNEYLETKVKGKK